MTKLALARARGVSNVWITRLLEGQGATTPIDEAMLGYPLVATYLLTGGRESKVTGLELDVSVDRRTITFRPNAWRRLKTPGSASRRAALASARRDPRRLPGLADSAARRPVLFPSPWSVQEAMIRHRSEVVEYRVEQHLERLGDRLQRVGLVRPSVTGNVTAAAATDEMEAPRDSASVSGAEPSDVWAWVELNYRPHAYQAAIEGPGIRHHNAISLTDRAICPDCRREVPWLSGINRHHNRHHLAPVCDHLNPIRVRGHSKNVKLSVS